VDAAVWTAIAIVVAMSFGTLVYFGSRIDVLAARLDARIDSGFARSTRDSTVSRRGSMRSQLDSTLI
jgi:hypothetical protein